MNLYEGLRTWNIKDIITIIESNTLIMSLRNNWPYPKSFKAISVIKKQSNT